MSCGYSPWIGEGDPFMSHGQMPPKLSHFKKKSNFLTVFLVLPLWSCHALPHWLFSHPFLSAYRSLSSCSSLTYSLSPRCPFLQLSCWHSCLFLLPHLSSSSHSSILWIVPLNPCFRRGLWGKCSVSHDLPEVPSSASLPCLACPAPSLNNRHRYAKLSTSIKGSRGFK